MVRKGVEEIVNGKILEYESKTIFQNGWREGYEQAFKEVFTEGYEEIREEIITAMLREGINIDRVAQIVKMKAEQVMAIGKKASVL